MLFISPPFGNYVASDLFHSIRGSFTLKPNPGLCLQICKTLRYSTEHHGWINKIGLRNKGLNYALQTYSPNDIISVAIRKPSEIPIIENKIPKAQNIELNVSCPNVGTSLVQFESHIKTFLNDEREWCIIKLSPQMQMKHIDTFYNDGFRQFHCCNTLPSVKGGISGPLLRPYVLNKIQYIKSKYPDTTVIAGGGVRDIHDAQEYLNHGADHVSVSTLCFNPWLMGLFVYEFCVRNQ